jgi:hypothetical protein
MGVTSLRCSVTALRCSLATQVTAVQRTPSAAGMRWSGTRCRTLTAALKRVLLGTA